MFLDVSEIKNIFIKKRVERNLIEYGAPQWVSGITFFSGTIKNLFCIAKKENNLIVEQYKDLVLVKQFSTPFTSISDFSVFRNKVLLKGYGSDFLGIVFEIDFAEKVLSNFSEKIHIDHIKDCSKPEQFWFKGFEDKSTHSFLYRPLVENLKSHLSLSEHIADQLHVLMDHIIPKFNIGHRRDFLFLKLIMEDHQDLAKYIERG